MRLYLTIAVNRRPWRWTGTQADAKATLRDPHAHDVQQVEVPTDKPSLLAWLNEQLSASAGREIGDSEVQLASDDELQLASDPVRPRVAGHCDACGRSAAGTLKLAQGNELDSVAQWLDTLQLSDLWVLKRAAELVRDRALAIGAEWDERTVQ